MTNGEKIKEIFPNITERFTNTDEYTNKPTKVEISVGMHILTTISVDVWSAEYKEPTTRNDLGVDLISRADAIKAMEDMAKKLTNEDTINGLCGAVAILCELPPVTPQEPKTGHWIDIQNYENICWECSNCKQVVTTKFNYCPNCGSDNREVENE